MIQFKSKTIDKSKNNIIINKSIEIDENLNFFILIDSEDKTFSDLFINKALDFTIDWITKENTYKDFTKILENLNWFLKTWIQDNENWLDDVSIILWINNNSDLYFSNMWQPSAYLIKNTNEVTEITDKDEHKKEFSFISEWKLDINDSIVFASSRLLNYLSYSDFNDCSIWNKIETLNNNIEEIILEEKIDKNIWIISLKYNTDNNLLKVKTNKTTDKLNNLLLKTLDNKFFKHIIAYFLIFKNSIKNNKLLKNIIFISGILIAFIILFYILTGIFWATTQKNDIKESNINIEEARQYVKIANNSISNPEIFNLNLSKAENIIKQLEEKKLFLNQTKKLKNDIITTKQIFNQIETFSEDDENLIYKLNQKNIIKIIEINHKIYLITKNKIVWPILENNDPQVNLCTIFDKDDFFIDATAYNNNILLITNSWKVVEFNKTWIFKFKDVKNQEMWGYSKKIKKFNSSIYLIENNKTQILKHTTNDSWKTFNKSIEYLTKDDETSWLKIIDIAIDWGIYILTDDLKIIKRVSKKGSGYNLENITINKIPNPEYFNIDKNIKNNNIKIKTLAEKNKYVYILLNNKIWIFKSNVWAFNLTYLWQIEWLNYKIIDFHIIKDWELDILNENWIYKLYYETNDNKINIL